MSAHSSAPWPISSCVGFACPPRVQSRGDARYAPHLGFASAAALIPRLLGRSRPASGLRVASRSIARRRALRASSASPRPPRSFLGSLADLFLRRVACRLASIARRRALPRLPRLRLGRRAHSSAPWPISSCVSGLRVASRQSRRDAALRASLGFASAAALIPRLLGRSLPASGLRVASRQSRGDARYAPPSASPRPPRSFLGSLADLVLRRVCVSPRVNRAATRASRLPRLRLGRRAHSSAPWPISSCVGFACRLASIARRRALRASLGFASAAALIPP